MPSSRHGMTLNGRNQPKLSRAIVYALLPTISWAHMRLSNIMEELNCSMTESTSLLDLPPDGVQTKMPIMELCCSPPMSAKNERHKNIIHVLTSQLIGRQIIILTTEP